MSFYPYLNFDGTAKEAFTRYAEIFGGELIVLGMDVVPGGDPVPEGFEGRTIHAALKLEDGGLLMASDTAPGEAPTPQGIYVNYAAADPEAARKAFDALAEGGSIEQPMQETFFSPAFGVCTDRWGTPWMVSAPGEDG